MLLTSSFLFNTSSCKIFIKKVIFSFLFISSRFCKTTNQKLVSFSFTESCAQLDRQFIHGETKHFFNESCAQLDSRVIHGEIIYCFNESCAKLIWVQRGPMVEKNISTCKFGMRTALSALYFITVRLQ